MQDRFKFRVWCKNKKEWEKDEIMITNNGKYFVTSSDIKKPFLITEADPIHHEINFCTGLKDKNGKLIYEGDIVRFKDNITINGSKTHISVVEHNETFNAFMYHAECMGLYTVNKAQNEYFDVEVIGNIYQNPELLED